MSESLAHQTTKVIAAGSSFPLGATPAADGVNFAVYSRTGTGAYLLLFDTANGEPTDVIELTQRDKFVWHAFVHGVRPGQLYGYKMHGDYKPEWGLRFNQAKLLLDPYAKAVTGKFRNTDSLLLAYDAGAGQADLVADARDNAAIVPKAIVVDDTFDWQGTSAPDLDLAELIIYEVHVKGFTAHPSSSVDHPGSYLGFSEKIPYLQRLGVNAVELLPVHEYYVDDFLVDKGLTNYWGYNSIGFFAPESSYAAGSSPGCQVTEFKTMVRELHRAGIKVILDVVYNHTGEGNEMGPTMSFRGLDNPSYYSLTGPLEAPRRYYMNFTGCGNSLRFDSPAVIRLAMDSLRYWVEVMHVDGFRFDLASVLGRSESGGFSASSPFFDAVSQDPVLNREGTILIAEPWDLGTYQVGNFPVDWSEWNGKFRDTLRRFIKGDSGQVADLGARLTGSADLYGDDGRSAFNSVNLLTCHDGFTLHDLVSYDSKHNDRNGEGNGASDNNSWNCGAEGDTDDPGVLALRARQMRNFFCDLLLSSGTPMILGGDEFARTQGGNNNAYCQDNDISWFDWNLVVRNESQVEFVSRLIAFTKRFPALQRRKFLDGQDLDGDGVPDLTWFSPSLGTPDWNDAELRTLCCQLDADPQGATADATRLYVILNAHFEAQWIDLPSLPAGSRWFRAIDTCLNPGEDFAAAGAEVPIDPGDHYIANSRSTVVLLAR
jgi:glycogen operon protein